MSDTPNETAREDHENEAAALIAQGHTYEFVAHQIGVGKTKFWEMRQAPGFDELVDQMRSMIKARAHGILAARAAEFANVYADWLIGKVSLTIEQVCALERQLGLTEGGADIAVGQEQRQSQQQATHMTVNVYPDGRKPEEG